MRTTVTLDDVVYQQARKIAFETRRSLGDVISELLAAGLEQSPHRRPQRTLGALRGSIEVPDGFDETPSDVIDAMDELLS